MHIAAQGGKTSIIDIMVRAVNQYYAGTVGKADELRRSIWNDATDACDGHGAKAGSKVPAPTRRY